MKTLVINNKSFEALDIDIMDGIYIPCSNKGEFVAHGRKREQLK